ncbi:iron-sulfur cluster-binding domain-containing protein [Chromobacterium vaccinii]|uniref:flavin reductase family protein n=1 Tax=Chromobacterium vaccinii TaxID=1108595 RepID=UPI001E3F4191|nr:iron-sulfur cluster-binding domain-containing protein [Chromobacterium vaccinii]MCD4483865.1 iron-sulfur cluster-binding domain-containing protein [Chromobacterium vaccinii]
MNNALVRCIDAFPKTETVTLYKFGLAHSGRQVEIGQHVTLVSCDDDQLNPGVYTVVDKLDDEIFCVAIKKTGRNSLADMLHQRKNIALRLDCVSNSAIEPRPKMLFVCGGVGITPALAVLRQRNTIYRGCDIHIVMSTERLTDSPFLDELLDSHFSDDKVRLNIFVTRGMLDKETDFLKQGRIDAERLMAVCPDLADRDSHIFGSHQFESAMRQIMRTHAGRRRDEPATQGGVVRIGEHLIEHDGETTLLDLCEAAGLSVPNRCRMGVCGSCKVTLRDGQVDSDDAVLSLSERERGSILACCAIPRGDIWIEL